MAEEGKIGSWAGEEDEEDRSREGGDTWEGH